MYAKQLLERGEAEQCGYKNIFLQVPYLRDLVIIVYACVISACLINCYTRRVLKALMILL